MPKPKPIIIADKILGEFLKTTNPLMDYGNGIWKLHADHLTFKTRSENENEFVIRLFPVSDQLYNKSLSYPFYIAFTICLNVRDEIRSVNIKIFKEDNTKANIGAFKETELLLRAEWSNETPEENANNIHAQPHWHIHSYQIIDKISTLPPEGQKEINAFMELYSKPNKTLAEVMIGHEVDESNSAEESGNLQETPMYKFHLAMLAEWDKAIVATEPQIINKILNENNFKTWLEPCLNYIKDQIEYILNRLPNYA